MGMAKLDKTWGITCLLGLAACGGSDTPEEMTEMQDQTMTTVAPQEKMPTMTESAGSTGTVAIQRALARIEPLMFPRPSDMSGMTAPAMMAAGMDMSAAGTSAADMSAAGMDAAGSGAAGMGATTGAAGSSGNGMGAGLAAGMGAAGMDAMTNAMTMGAAGMDAAMAAGAGGITATTTTTTAASTTGAAGAEAPVSISGTANFSSGADGVTLTVMVSGCADGKQYPIHIHQGTSCESAEAQGPHWDMTRGENIPNVMCGGGQGVTMHTRAGSDPTTAWSVGDGSATDVVGHVIVIHDADIPSWRIACGVIAKN